MNEVYLHQLFKYIRNMFEKTVYSWFEAGRDIVFALISSVIPNLPFFIQMPLEYIGVTKYLRLKADNYENFAEKQKEDAKKYNERIKEIEKNRPISPSKTTKIDLSGDIQKVDNTGTSEPKTLETRKASSPTKTVPGKTQKVWDTQTKSFKIVPVKTDKPSQNKAPKNQSKTSSNVEKLDNQTNYSDDDNK